MVGKKLKVYFNGPDDDGEGAGNDQDVFVLI